MNFKALKTSILLSLLFFLVYGGSNQLAAIRHHVGSIYFEWERLIPFVPLMILPYTSINLFFVAAPFLCGDDRERRLLAKRMAAAILVTGAFFLAFPLQFAFGRPPAQGIAGVLFAALRGFDRPFNQFPSLHVVLGVILLAHYSKHTSGALRVAVWIWFLLIFASTVMTFQHHSLDVVGGLFVGMLLMYLIGPEPLRQPLMPNRRVGGYYLALGVTLAAIAGALPLGAAGKWGFGAAALVLMETLLIWLALCPLIVAAGYFFLGPGIYRKCCGRIPFTAGFFLWPMMLGQAVSLWHYRRRCATSNKLTDGVWIGRIPTAAEARLAVEQGVTAVLELTCEFSETRAIAPASAAVAYKQLLILDLTAPTPRQLREAIEFTNHHAAKSNTADKRAAGIVYLHCKAGYSRTAAVAGAWLLATGRASSAAEAADLLRAARPSIIIRPEVMRAIEDFAQRESPVETAALRTPADAFAPAAVPMQKSI